MPQTLSQISEPHDKAAQDEIILDGARLRRSLRRQSLLWLWLGPLAAGLLFLGLAAFVPRTYTATTSVALQQPSSVSPLAQLTGGGGASKRYLGVLKSRALAAGVERHVQLRQLYGAKTFHTEEDAVEFLMKSVKPDDSATDGLLYIAVSLPGPPKLGLHPSPSVPQVENAAADVANDYALALKEYFTTSDTDQGAALLHGADREVRLARARYEEALGQSLDFTRGLSRVDPRSLPASSPASGIAGPGQTPGGDMPTSPFASVRGVDAATASSGLAGLYVALNQVQAELSETQAVRATGQALISTQLQDLSRVPTDDPLLTDVRNRVTQDRIAFQTLSALYPPGSEDQHPNLLAARQRLDFDEADLNRQKAGIKQRLTTPDVRSAETIKGLYARQAKLLDQIAAAQRHLGTSRQLSGEAGRLQAEVGLQLGVLQTTLSEAEKVKLNNASSQSRMSVIDTALPPKSGEPGAAKLVVACLALAIAGFLIGIVVDYSRSAPPQPEAVLPGSGINGSGALPAENTEAAALHAAQKQYQK